MSPRMLIHSHARTALILGVIEGSLGIGMLILSFLFTSNSKDMMFLNPYVCASVCMVGGLIGINVGITKHRCAMMVFLVCNIILTIIQSVFAIIAGLVAAILQSFAYHVDKYCHYDKQRSVCVCNISGSQHDYDGLGECDTLSKLATWLTALVVLAGISAALALSISIFSCVAVCCTQSVSMEPILIEQLPLQEK